MPRMPLEELIERCINEDWEYSTPCQAFSDVLNFPEGDFCDENCVKCLLKASGWDKVEG